LYFRLEIRWAFWDLIMLHWQLQEHERCERIESKAAVVARLRDTAGIALSAMRSRLDLDLDRYANDYQQFQAHFPTLRKWWTTIGSLSVLLAKEITRACLSDDKRIGDDVRGREIEEISVEAASMFMWLSSMAGLPTPSTRTKLESPLGDAISNGQPVIGDEELDRIIAPLLLQYQAGSKPRYWALSDPG
jgi:hypothetical protein